MILFLILAITVSILLVFTIAAVSIGGAAFIIVFGDVIVCILLIVWLLRYLARRRR